MVNVWHHNTSKMSMYWKTSAWFYLDNINYRGEFGNNLSIAVYTMNNLVLNSKKLNVLYIIWPLYQYKQFYWKNNMKVLKTLKCFWLTSLIVEKNYACLYFSYLVERTEKEKFVFSWNIFCFSFQLTSSLNHFEFNLTISCINLILLK